VAVLVAAATVGRELAAILIMAVVATLKTLDIHLLSSRSRRRSIRVGGEGYKRDRGRLNLIHRRLLAPLGDDGLVVSVVARRLFPSTNSEERT
jgi:hypothetical protein